MTAPHSLLDKGSSIDDNNADDVTASILVEYIKQENIEQNDEETSKAIKARREKQHITNEKFQSKTKIVVDMDQFCRPCNCYLYKLTKASMS